LLPLRDHISDYYLAIPSAGLAMLGGWGFAEAMRSRRVFAVIAAVLAVVYAAASATAAREVVRWNYEHSRAARNLFFGVERAHQLHPGKTILLTGVSTDLFWSGMADFPFRLLGIKEVYLAPGTEANIDKHPEVGDVEGFVLPPAIARRAIMGNRAVVYDASAERLRNITSAYAEAIAKKLSEELPDQVRMGDPLYSAQLGDGWYPPEANGFAWMKRTASVRMKAREGKADSLVITGYASSEAAVNGPPHLRVTISGIDCGQFEIPSQSGTFEITVKLPPGKFRGEQLIQLTADRVFIPKDESREVSVALQSVAFR
jgi:hypothetical protein